MKKVLILSLVLVGMIISGCVEQDVVKPEYDDEALKMETEVTGEVLPSQSINLKVRLTSQVPDDVRDVNFDITDLYGIEILKINCGTCSCGGGNDNTCAGGVKCYSDISKGHRGCYFSEIQSLDDKEIDFVLKIPSNEELARIGRELKPELTLEYTYDGETTYLIPILGATERSTDAKPQLIKTWGPIKAEIERGFTSSNYDWERNGSGFSIVIRFEDVLTTDSHVTIDKDKVKITLNNNLYADPSGSFGRCDLKWDTDHYEPEKNITLPMQTPIVCALEARNLQNLPWVYGQVKVDFDNYRYKAVETKSINVETVIV